MNELKFQFVGTGETKNRNQEKVTITATLTSKIETRQDYHYGFFKSPDLVDSGLEFPVIFKNQEGYYRPNLSKDSTFQLKGNWSPGKERPSFTCYDYDVIGKPELPTLKSLQKEIQALINPTLKQKKDWSETTDFLFRKLAELKKIEQLSQLGSPYLKAYFLTENARYANYQAEHLPQANFNLESYLKRIASELEITQRQMISAGWKESK